MHIIYLQVEDRGPQPVAAKGVNVLPLISDILAVMRQQEDRTATAAVLSIGLAGLGHDHHHGGTG